MWLLSGVSDEYIHRRNTLVYQLYSTKTTIQQLIYINNIATHGTALHKRSDLSHVSIPSHRRSYKSHNKHQCHCSCHNRNIKRDRSRSINSTSHSVQSIDLSYKHNTPLNDELNHTMTSNILFNHVSHQLINKLQNIDLSIQVHDSDDSIFSELQLINELSDNKQLSNIDLSVLSTDCDTNSVCSSTNHVAE